MIHILFGSSLSKYNCAKSRHCRICATDFRERGGGPSCTGLRVNLVKQKTLISLAQLIGIDSTFTAPKIILKLKDQRKVFVDN